MFDLNISSLDIYKMSTAAIRKKILQVELAIVVDDLEGDMLDEAEELISILQDELEMRAEG
jgi:hypothetical protein